MNDELIDKLKGLLCIGDMSPECPHDYIRGDVTEETKQSAAYKQGIWDGFFQAIQVYFDRIDLLRGMSEPKTRLLTSGHVFGDSLPVMLLNLNDVFAWGCADAEKVEDDQVEPLARLISLYGSYGGVYWASKKRGYGSEHADIQANIEAVARSEERAEERAGGRRKQRELQTKPTGA